MDQHHQVLAQRSPGDDRTQPLLADRRLGRPDALGPLDLVQDLEEQLLHQRGHPGRPRGRSGRRGIRDREHVEHLQPAARADAFGQPGQERRVVQVPPGGRVGQQEMLAHQELDVRLHRRRLAQRGRGRGREAGSGLGVIGRVRALAQVVQQTGEQEPLPLRSQSELRGEQTAQVIRTAAGGHLDRRRHAPERVPVDRVRVQAVALAESSGSAPNRGSTPRAVRDATAAATGRRLPPPHAGVRPRAPAARRCRPAGTAAERPSAGDPRRGPRAPPPPTRRR